MLDVIMTPVITVTTPEYLAILIEEYLSAPHELFPRTMKPKHHFLIHYPHVMKLMGPLWRLCSMRFESKHKVGKQVSRNANCRINVCHT